MDSWISDADEMVDDAVDWTTQLLDDMTGAVDYAVATVTQAVDSTIDEDAQLLDDAVGEIGETVDSATSGWPTRATRWTACCRTAGGFVDAMLEDGEQFASDLVGGLAVAPPAAPAVVSRRRCWGWACRGGRRLRLHEGLHRRMTLQVAVTIVVGAASIIVASAALYVAGLVRRLVGLLEAVDQRSRENREILTGDAAGTRDVLPWLRELDEEVDRRG